MILLGIFNKIKKMLSKPILDTKEIPVVETNIPGAKITYEKKDEHK